MKRWYFPTKKRVFAKNFFQCSIVLMGWWWQIGLLTISAFLTANAQDSLVFCLEKNVIHNDSILHPFYEKLSWLEKEQKGIVHVLHLGDSHVQADFFTERIREIFCEENKFPLASRGFLFPYKAAQSNNPLNYKVHVTGLWKGLRSVISHHQSRWGLAGITATTYDTMAQLTITLLPTKHCPTPFNEVRLFYHHDSTSFEPLVQLDNDSLLFPIQTENGVAVFQLPNEQEQIKLVFQKKRFSQQQFVLQGFFFAHTERQGIIYSASGANGAEFSTYFRCQDFFTQARQIQPSLLIVSLGTNDAHHLSFDSLTFATTVRTFITRLREELPHTPLLLTTPNDSKRKRKIYNPDVLKAKNCLLSLSNELGFAVWDFYEIMGGYKSIDRWGKLGLAQKDFLHLTQKGYRWQGELFYDAIYRSYEKYKQKSE